MGRAELEVSVLGPVRVRVDDELVAVAGKREATVVAVLALHAPGVVAVDVLGDGLWGDAMPRTYRKTMQGFVHRLRRQFGAAFIETDGDGYRLGSDVALDNDRLTRLAESCRDERDAGEYADMERAAAAALGLVRGPAFADLQHWDRSSAETSRIDELVHLLEEWHLEARILQRTRAGESVADAERLVINAPPREQRWLLLIRAHLAADRPAEALRAYGRAQRTLADELGAHPGPDMQQQYRVLLELTAEAPPTAAHSWIPRPVSSFGGRRSELAEVTSRLGRSRLTTLVGPGGVGKTRLAIEAAHRHRERSGHPVWFVDIDQADAAEAVVGLVNQALLGTPAEASTHAVGRTLGTKDALLVIDNAEQVADELTAIARHWLESAPGLRILVTSRHRLATTDADVMVIGPLSDDDAIWLFNDRALRRSGTSARVDPAVTRAICHAVDNLPLGIELAASRTDLLTPAELLTRLAEAPGESQLLARPDTARSSLHEAIRSSYEQLPPEPRRLLHRLTILDGAFGIESASNIWPGDRTATEAAIRDLLERSLLDVVEVEPRRLRVLDLIRAWVIEQPGSADDRADGELALLHHWNVATEMIAEWNETNRHAAAISLLNRERSSLQVAIRLATTRDPQLAAQLMIRTDDWWRATNRTLIAWRLLAEILDDERLDEAPDVLGRALLAALVHGSQSLDVEPTDIEHLAVRLRQVVASMTDQLEPQLGLAMIQFSADDPGTFARLQQLLNEAEASAPAWVPTVLDFLGRWLVSNDPLKAREVALECLRAADRGDNEISTAHAQELVASAHIANGQPAEAANWLRRATATFTVANHPGCLLHCYETVAWLAAEAGDTHLAERLLGAVIASRQQHRRNRLAVEWIGFRHATLAIGTPEAPHHDEPDKLAAQLAGQILSAISG